MIALGSNEISKVCLGSNELSKVCLGSTEIWSSQPSPSVYDAEIEYLQSSGTQYIDTGIPYKSTISVEFDAHRLDTSTAGPLFGIFYKDSNNVSKRWLLNCGTNSRLYAYFGEVTNKYYTMNASNWYHIEADYTHLSINGGAEQDIGASAFTTEGRDANIYIFTRHETAYDSDSGPGTIIGNKISTFKIYDEGTLVRHFIPVRVGQVGYFYDKVSHTLFGNAGTGDFILGNDIVPVEYIQSSGTQWISARFLPNNNTSVLMNVIIPSDGIVSLFFESRHTAWRNEFGLINMGDSNNQLQVRFGNRNGGTKLRNKLPAPGSYKIFMDKNNVYVDDVLIGTATSYTFQSDYNLLLFALNSGGSVTATNGNYGLCDCKIYDNGTLVRDFIPVRAGQEGMLYDKVSEFLFWNFGSGDFTLGNDKSV